MNLTDKERMSLLAFVDPLLKICALPGYAAEQIAADEITPGYLDEIQRHIDTVLYTAGRPVQEFGGTDAKEFQHLQMLAAQAHFSLRRIRSYKWDIPKRK